MKFRYRYLLLVISIMLFTRAFVYFVDKKMQKITSEMGEKHPTTELLCGCVDDNCCQCKETITDDE